MYGKIVKRKKLTWVLAINCIVCSNEITAIPQEHNKNNNVEKNVNKNKKVNRVSSTSHTKRNVNLLQKKPMVNDKLTVIAQVEAKKLQNVVESVNKHEDAPEVKKEVSVESLLDNVILEKYSLLVSESNVSIEEAFAKLIIEYAILMVYGMKSMSQKDRNNDIMSLQVNQKELGIVLNANKALIMQAPCLSDREIAMVDDKFTQIASIVLSKIDIHNDKNASSKNSVDAIFHILCQRFEPLFIASDNLKLRVYDIIRAMASGKMNNFTVNIKRNIDSMLYRVMLTFLSCPDYMISVKNNVDPLAARTRLLLILSHGLFESSLFVSGIGHVSLKTLPKQSFRYKKLAIGISVALLAIGGMAYLTHAFKLYEAKDNAPQWKKNLASVVKFLRLNTLGEKIKNVDDYIKDTVSSWFVKDVVHREVKDMGIEETMTPEERHKNYPQVYDKDGKRIDEPTQYTPEEPEIVHREVKDMGIEATMTPEERHKNYPQVYDQDGTGNTQENIQQQLLQKQQKDARKQLREQLDQQNQGLDQQNQGNNNILK